jgi:hypothetical protein
MKHLHNPNSDKGVAAILVGASLVLMMGMAAIAVDLGRGFNERRQDQTAADMAVMSASVDALSGVVAIRDTSLQFVRNNLDTTYSAAEWQAMWEGCTDPNRNTGGFAFQSVPPPAGWSSLDCISVDPAGYIRVKVPDQIVGTTFGRVIGTNQINTNAAAIARLGPRSDGGILPFGVTAAAGTADHVCLSSGPTGLAIDPCEGASSGNFGTLKSPLYGNPDMGTPENCTSSPLSDVLALNIAIGLDHLVTLAPSTAAATEIRDVCFNFGVNTLLTDVGFPNNGAEEGLVGPLPSFSPAGAKPRLAQGPSADLVTRFGKTVNNKPLWEYIDSSLTDSDIPASCVRSSFDNSNPVFDWDGDGNDDNPGSWQHLEKCLADYRSGGYTTVMFSQAIGTSPRFGYVPQFHESSLGSGSSWLHIKSFRATWLQGTWWKKGNDWQAFHPGEACSSCSASGYNMKQLSAFLLPDNALPQDLRGDPPPWADGLNPFRPYLYR